MLSRFVVLSIFAIAHVQATQANEGTDKGIFSMTPENVVNVRGEKTKTDQPTTENFADDMFLLTPEEVGDIRTQNQKIEEAKFQTIIDPIVESVIFDRHLEPNEQPVVAYGIENSPTAIQFIDATGEPWPIHKALGRDGAFFTLQPIENEYKNSVIASGNQPAGIAFATIYLRDEPEPITVKFVVNNEIFNPKVTVRIMRTGPNAKQTIETLSSLANNKGSQERYMGDEALNSALSGITPLDAKRALIRVDGALDANVDAWLIGNDVLIRTRLTLFSPQYKQISLGTSGYKAYRMPYSPVIYGNSPEGKVVKLIIKGDK